jgi:SWI/SNF-related matrix-associated actin-dependent regulator of chromatin subfamily A containing DEAD/H box 1
MTLKYPKALGKFKYENDPILDSGKVQKLVELLLKFKKNGDRTLVFSQFVLVMDILERVFEQHGIRFLRLDGNTPVADRQALLDEFYEDESIHVFMLSTKSGGAGINLACANKVVIFDQSFNPQDDVQAENRAHRVGQTREVEVIRLVTKGTIEEHIHALGNSKLELDRMVSGEDETGTKKSKDGLTAGEEKGLASVEKMLMEQLDVKEQFMGGLKKVSATAPASS